MSYRDMLRHFYLITLCDLRAEDISRYLCWILTRGVTILQIFDSIIFSIVRSWFGSIQLILDITFIYFFRAQVAMPFLD